MKKHFTLTLTGIIIQIVFSITAFAQCVTISSWPASATAGSTISISGTVNIYNNTGTSKIQQVDVYVAPNACSTSGQIGYNTACASMAGNFSTNIFISNSATPGTYKIWAYVQSSASSCGYATYGCSCLTSEAKTIIITANTGSLQVDLNPDAAVAAGAQWNVDNGPWKNDLEIVTGLSVGSHTVYYKTISGWTAPPPSTVNITGGNTTCLCPAPPYVQIPQTGSLQVDLNPDAAVAAGAQWNVDNGPWKNDLEIVSGLSLGNHTVYFKAITGWAAPSPSLVNITANNTTCLCPAPPYTQSSQTGSLQVDLNPDAAVAAGAQWNVDNGSWKNDLETVFNLSAGSHTVYYKSISGWTAPSPSTVNITANNTYCLCPAPPYTQGSQTGSLQVDLNPDAAVAAGAQWNVDNGPWKNDLEIVSGLSVGSHTVYYKAISGWSAPSPSSVNITANNVTCLCPAPPYTQNSQTGSLQVDLNPDAAVAAGAQWNVDNGPWKNDLETVSGLVIGSHTVYYKDISGWTAPSPPSTVNITANNTTCLCPAPPYVQNPQTGSLQVDLNPDAAVAAGAQWNVDNGPWKNDLETLSGLMVGSHTVYFKGITGWTAPLPSSVNITANNIYCLCPAPPYTQNAQTGSLQVDLNPDGAVAAGAQWNVDNGSWMNDLEILSGLSAGTHMVYFKAITGWSAPPPSTVTIVAYNTVCLCPAPPYTQSSQTGSLTVDLNPDGAVAAGAEWNVDYGPWNNDLQTVSDLTVGSHTVYYKTVSGWTAPAPSTVNITSNNTTCLCPAPPYVQNSSSCCINVVIGPAAALSAGAQWNIDGGPWQNSGIILCNLSVGSHTVNYKSIVGWTSCSSSTVTLTVNNTKTESCTYIPYYLPILIVTDIVPDPNNPGYYLPFENILDTQNINYQVCDVNGINSGSINLNNYSCVVLTSNSLELIIQSKNMDIQNSLTEKNMLVYKFDVIPNNSCEIPNSHFNIRYDPYTKSLFTTSKPPTTSFMPIPPELHLDLSNLLFNAGELLLGHYAGEAVNTILLSRDGVSLKTVIGILNTALEPVAASLIYILPYCVVTGGQVCIAAAGVGTLYALTLFPLLFDNVITIESHMSENDVLWMDILQHRLNYASGTIDCNYYFENDANQFPICKSNADNILGVTVWNYNNQPVVNLNSLIGFKYNSYKLKNQGDMTIQATPPQVTNDIYEVDHSGNKDLQGTTIIDFDLVDNEFSYPINGNMFTFHMIDTATCFHSELKLIKNNDIVSLNSNIEYSDNDFIIDSTKAISTLTSVQSFPSILPTANINTPFTLKLLPSVVFSKNGFFQIKVDTSVVFTKNIIGGTNIIDTISIPLSSIDTGLRNYTIYLQYRPWVTTGPLLSTEITDVVKTINYQVDWEKPEGIENLNDQTFSIFPNPAFNLLTISSKLPSSKVEIYDMVGKLLLSKEIHCVQNIIDISNIKCGLYLIKISDGKRIYVQKLSKL
ncbi:MAG: T9SS type A sorting domain-containing protein [Bacteroidales bacterium]|nr:T9SS type A sorting domain-containing protein [Bacteroidales bacterium]